MRVWIRSSKSLLHTFSGGHKGMVMCLDFSPNGAEFLASGGSDNKVVLWRIRDHSKFHTIEEHMGTVCCVAFSPDTTAHMDKRVVIKNKERCMEKFEIRTGTLMTGAGDMRIKMYDMQDHSRDAVEM